MTKDERPPPLTGGPHGVGDPNDKRLRKTEKDIIIPKMMREEATERCKEEAKPFFDCCKEFGMMAPFKCQEENSMRLECLKTWMSNPEFMEEITNKYIHARSYYRATGQPLERFKRNH